MANAWDVQGAWTPQNWDELKGWARANSWSEDFDRQQGDKRTFDDWIGNYWDANARKFRSEKRDEQGNAIQGWVEKPMDTPEGWSAYRDFAVRSDDRRLAQNQGGGGGFGGGSGGGGGTWGGGSGAGWGQFQIDPFQAPSYEDMRPVMAASTLAGSMAAARAAVRFTDTGQSPGCV